MRTADIDYDFEVPGLGKVMLTVCYGIDFEIEGRGTEEASVILKATPQTIQGMIGGMPFSQVEWSDVPKQYPLHDWIRARKSELTFEAIGYTEDEAGREAAEENDELDYMSRQIGRPI